MKEKILLLLKDKEFLNRSSDLLAKELKIDGSDEFVSFIKLLNEMEDEGLIVRNKHNHYYLPENLNMIVGTLSLNAKGFGFVSIGEDEEDIFISPNNLKDAFNQDVVLVEKMKHSSGSREEGQIVKIIKRGQTRFVGEVKKGKYEFIIEVDDQKFKQPIYVDKAHIHGAVVGHKVVVEIKQYKPYLKGNVVEVIGHKNDPGVDILSIVYNHDAPMKFGKEVFEQISEIEDEISQDEASTRFDLRDEVVVTIDGDDAKDLDDGISLKKLDNGNYYLGVHIADVSYYVEEGSPLDKEAFERSTSIYLVDRVIPMLPHKLSNGICSLNPHVDRLAISCFMEIDSEGKVVNHEIKETVINSTERMTYNNVNKILDGDMVLQEEYSHVKDLFFMMQELATILQDRRSERGAIDFDVDEAKVLVNEYGKPVDVVLRQRGNSDRIIESFMLVANETIAEHFKWLDLPFIYRVHENPREKKLQQFSTIARTLGYTIKGSLENIYPGELSAIIEASKDTPEHPIISTLLLRCMAKARYDEQCLGHFGLADEFYTHFTSPIRRYPDLIVHRLIRKYLFEGKIDSKTIKHYQKLMPEIALQTSSCERRAIEIEREVDDMKIAEYMEDHIGETFEGIISSITNFGMFIELPNTIEGLVRMEDLCDDYYFYDEKNLQLLGQRTGKKFKMSDKVKVIVSGASKANKQVDFQIVGIKSNKKPKKTVIINKRRHSDERGRGGRNVNRNNRHHKNNHEVFNKGYNKKRKRKHNR